MESIDKLIEELRITLHSGCIGVPSGVCGKYASCGRHQNALIDAIESGVAEMKVFIDRLREAAGKREDVTLFDVDYTACPRDVNKEQWHIGDLAQSVLFPTLKPKKVCGFGTINGMPVVFYVSESGTGHSSEKHQGWDYAENVRIYRNPTVEDVLSEFASRVCNSGHQWGLDAADTIAEYATKFQLAGDE